MSAPRSPPWSPYGLEAIRIAHLRRRRILGLLVALGLAGMWLYMFDTTTTSELDISVNGQSQRNGVSIQVPEEEEKKDGPVTVGVSPGRVVRAETGNAEPDGPRVSRSSIPTFERADPYNWSYYILMYGPWVLLALAVYFLAKRRGRYDEVNYGVYKGSMPLEMITASAAKHVFTTRHARASVFGKRARDHLPPALARAEPAAQEDDA